MCIRPRLIISGARHTTLSAGCKRGHFCPRPGQQNCLIKPNQLPLRNVFHKLNETFPSRLQIFCSSRIVLRGTPPGVGRIELRVVPAAFPVASGGLSSTKTSRRATDRRRVRRLGASVQSLGFPLASVASALCAIDHADAIFSAELIRLADSAIGIVAPLAVHDQAILMTPRRE